MSPFSPAVSESIPALHGVPGQLSEALLWYSDGHGPWEPSSSLRVGIDLVLVEDVAGSVERFGQRYVDRIFTDHEIVYCRGDDSTGTASYLQRLAARFAAKEAMVKILRPVGARPAWRDIEVRSESGGWTGMRLSGLAADLADEAGIEQVAVSLTHEEPMAAALVVGVCRNQESPDSSVPTDRRTTDRRTTKDRREE
jgi:holo-[acyl-carrier protein] synthase